MSQNSAPFIDCMTDTNNVMGQAGPINIIMSIYNLIEYSIYYSKSPGSLWQCLKGEPWNTKVNTTDVNSESFKLRSCFTEEAVVDGDNGKVKDIKTEVP